MKLAMIMTTIATYEKYPSNCPIYEVEENSVDYNECFTSRGLMSLVATNFPFSTFHGRHLW